MSLIPIRKAFDASTRNSAYIFLCPHRNFPVIMQYQSLHLLADINDVDSVLSLLEMHDFDDFECGVYENHAMWQLVHSGYTVSAISRMTDIQPLEVAMYYSGIVAPDEETMRILLERTGHRNVSCKPLNYVYGESVNAL